MCDRVKGPSQTRVFAACVSQREGQQHMPEKVHIYARSKNTPRVPTARLTRVFHSQTCTNPPNRPRPETHNTAFGARHPPTHILHPITRSPRKRFPQQSLLVRTDNVGNNGVQKRGVPGPRDVKTTVQRLVRRARVQLPHTPCMPFASRPPLHALSQADPPCMPFRKPTPRMRVRQMLTGQRRAGLCSGEGGAGGSTCPTPTCEVVRSGSGRSEVRRRRCP